MALKLDGFLKPYRGKEDDLEAFWSKFMVLAKVNKWNDDETKMTHLPLMLDRGAYLVFDALSDTDKKDAGAVKSALTAAFAPSAAESYRAFTSRSLRGGESVDAYVADLKRMLTASGHKLAVDDKDPMLVEQLIRGLPRDYAREIRIQCSSADKTISEIVQRIRAMAVDDCAAGVGGGKSSVAAVSLKPVVCFNCGQAGHMKRNCPDASTGTRGGSGGSGAAATGRGPVKCFKCKKLGHIKKNCPLLAADKSVAAVATARTGSTDVCTAESDSCVQAGESASPRMDVCLPVPESVRRSSELIRLSVGVSGSDCKLNAIVDTGCTRSLITKAGVTSAKAEELVQPTMDGVVGIDGKPLNSCGTVSLEVHETEETVYLEPVEISFLVVDNLTVLDTDVVLGSDVVSHTGGLNLQYKDGAVQKVVFGKDKPAEIAASAPKLSRHVRVANDGNNVVMHMDDAEVVWHADEGYWSAKWLWKDGKTPSEPIGSGIGEYPRNNLTDDQEKKFADEIEMWIRDGWLVPYDKNVHGPPGAVLPLIASVQEHKASTPVRPCLDYRLVNEVIKSSPGYDAPATDQKLREWRQLGADNFMLDVCKAYLQVRIDPSLLRYQMVAFGGKTYVMERMGFGLCIAPKVMDTIVKFVTQGFRRVDNFVDDLIMPKSAMESVKAKLAEFGLPTKPAEELQQARVLGLQLSESDGTLQWRRRDGVDLRLPASPTCRNVFQWCGRIISHYPVCSWLRPYCSYVKRLANPGQRGWDSPIPGNVERLCRDLEKQVATGDPVHGRWDIDPTSSEWTVWCDASNLAIGVVLEEAGAVVEDGCWMRPESENHHINVAELEAIIKGLSVCVSYKLQSVKVMTDSKSVFGWVKSMLTNTCRVKVSGLNEALVRRRLEIIEDIVDSYGMQVELEWVQSQKNRADRLTRVPSAWLKKVKTSDVSVAAGVVPGPISLDEIRKAQKNDPVVLSTMRQLEAGQDVSVMSLQKVKSQLTISGGLLVRSVKLPPDEVVEVPVLPSELEQRALEAAHVNTGHGSWEATQQLLRSQCYFPNQAAKTQAYVQECGPCRAANAKGSQSVSPSRPVMPGAPWRVVQVDTLELGPSRTGHHCVLVCYDVFTKWAEVVPLKSHNAKSVAAAMVEVCARWGPPEVIRSDNGTEFVNAMLEALYDTFGVVVRHGAVRHPQSQGAAERFNRTLLTMLRKIHEESIDWKADLAMLLHYYHNRAHGTLKISPAKAMLGWEPRNLVVQQEEPVQSLSTWSTDLERRAASIRDYVDETLSAGDFIEEAGIENQYRPGDLVQLKRSERAQKLLPAYERGWKVVKPLSHSTVVICDVKQPQREKVVNNDLLKSDVPGYWEPAAAPQDKLASDDDNAECALELCPQPEPAVVPGNRVGRERRQPGWQHDYVMY